MRSIRILLLVIFFVGFLSPAADTSEEDYRNTLRALLKQTDVSIQLSRKQILNSQAAPFLPDLYLKLGELLTQRAAVLYYVDKEKYKDKADFNFENSQGVALQKEAMDVFKRVLSDYPKFDKRAKAYYFLCLSAKTLESVPELISASSQLFQQYPNSKETMQVKLLLGQHYFDKGQFEMATTFLKPVVQSNFSYEKNLGKFRMGLIFIASNKPKEALKNFEEIILDKSFEDIKGPTDSIMQLSSMDSNLRREALLESVRAFTALKMKNPIEYYSKLSTNEQDYFAVLEKLSARYVFLKDYPSALNVIRSLSPLVASAQKVVGLYRTVLGTLPLDQRKTISVDEMKFVLAKWQEWSVYYQLSPEVKKSAYDFFEMQLRELATSMHESSKSNSIDKGSKLQRSLEFYKLYLAYFKGSANAKKIALNLADIYYLKGDYTKSSEWYLRIASGEFGKENSPGDLYKNAIATSQKEPANNYYEQIRIRGLLIASISQYQKVNPKAAQDPQLNFLLAKANYEQGNYGEAVNRLYQVARTSPQSPYAVKAGELIIEYYNLRKDYKEMNQWAVKLAGISQLDTGFRQKMVKISKQSKVELIQEQVRSVAGYDEFNEAKSYLDSAEQFKNLEVRESILKQALAKSRSEGDIQTYFKVADTFKKPELQISIAKERIRLTDFSLAYSKLSSIKIKESFIAQVELALAMKDLLKLLELSKNAFWNDLPASLKNQYDKLILSVKEMPISIPGMSKKMDSSEWSVLRNAELDRNLLQKVFLNPAKNVQEIEVSAQKFSAITQKLEGIASIPTAHFAMIHSLYLADFYSKLSTYLKRSADNISDLKQALEEKSKQSMVTAKKYLQQCRDLANRGTHYTPANEYCVKGSVGSFKEMTEWKKYFPLERVKNDLNDSATLSLKKKLLVGGDTEDAYLKLSKTYFKNRMFLHAIGTAQLGLSQYVNNKSFKTVLGCSLTKIGFMEEGLYHLKGSGESCASL